MIHDKFTGKPVDRVSDRFPTLNGSKCDECGTECISHCLTCGAPQCCPKCCADATSESEVDSRG